MLLSLGHIRPRSTATHGVYETTLGRSSNFNDFLSISYHKADVLSLAYLILRREGTTMELPNEMHPDMALLVKRVRAALHDPERGVDGARAVVQRFFHRLPSATILAFYAAVDAAKSEIEDAEPTPRREPEYVFEPEGRTNVIYLNYKTDKDDELFGYFPYPMPMKKGESLRCLHSHDWNATTLSTLAAHYAPDDIRAWFVEAWPSADAYGKREASCATDMDIDVPAEYNAVLADPVLCGRTLEIFYPDTTSRFIKIIEKRRIMPHECAVDADGTHVGHLARGMHVVAIFTSNIYTSQWKACADGGDRSAEHQMSLAVVQLNGMALRHIRDQTPEICLAAVQQNGLALRCVTDQTPEICMAAVKQHGRALQYVRDQTPEICLAANPMLK